MIKDLIKLSWQLIKDVFEDHWLWTITIMVIILIMLAGCAKPPKTELKAMDQFFDKLLQNATPTDENKSK
jgi:uncharacterized lipoprotein YajG|tara:strand:+ start:42 stop:251 length:210 start_codon:yes stop_codon:yes gene_type:complete